LILALLGCGSPEPAAPPPAEVAAPPDPLDALAVVVDRQASEAGATRVYTATSTGWPAQGLVEADPDGLAAANATPGSVDLLRGRTRVELQIAAKVSDAFQDLEARQTGKAVWVQVSAPALSGDDALVLSGTIASTEQALTPDWTLTRLRAEKGAWVVVSEHDAHVPNLLSLPPGDARACAEGCPAGPGVEKRWADREITWWLRAEGQPAVKLGSADCVDRSENDSPMDVDWCERTQIAWLRTFDVSESGGVVTVRSRPLDLWRLDGEKVVVEPLEWRVP
jgi:hypothetical protein